jgi:O-antigen/teichoic acid export membrane protein
MPQANPHRPLIGPFEGILRRSWISDGAWAFTAKALGALLAILVNALLARLLSPESLGAYFLTLSAASVLAILAQGGLNHAVVRLVAEPLGLGRLDVARAAATASMKGCLAGSLLIAAIFALGGGQWLALRIFHSSEMAGVAGVAAIWIVVLALQGVQAETFRGFREIRDASLFGGVVASGLSAALLAALWSMHVQCELRDAIALTVGATLVSIVTAHVILMARLGRLPRGGALGAPGIASIAAPMLVANLTLFFLTQADLWIIGAFRPHEEVALYGAASRLAVLVTLPLLVVNAVFPPVIAQYYAQGRKPELERLLRAAATWAALSALLVAALFLAGGAWMLDTVFGAYYRGGALILVILSIGHLANVWTGSCGFALAMTGHQRVMMWITVMNGVATVICGVAAAPRFGSTGVAIVAATFAIVQNIALLIAARRLVGIWTHGSIAYLMAYRGVAAS